MNAKHSGSCCRPREKALGVPELVAIALGGMVGGGIFTILGISVAMIGVYTPVAIALGGVIAALAAYSYIQLGVYYKDEGATYCSLCSRLRRGHLYRIAREEKCSAIVLGHHMDDLLETFFLNLFHGGQLSTMSPKLKNDEGDLIVLRPLAYALEKDLEKFADALDFPIIPCNLCGSQNNLQRVVVREMLENWERETPGRKSIMAAALTNVRPSHLLDPKLFDFEKMERLARKKDERMKDGVT